MKEWDYEENNKLGILPEDCTSGSGKKVHWKCAKGHQWQTVVKDRTFGKECPYCSGRYAVTCEDDLETTHPELAKAWHPSKNGDLKPSQISAGSHKKVWWICSNNHSWTSIIKNRTYGYGCPTCNESKGEKSISELLNRYKIKYTSQYKTNDCRHKNPLPFDFAIFDKNNNLVLLIEYDGEQHYKAIPHFGVKKSLLDRMQKDKIKTDYCRNNNIPLLRIPYWEFDSINKIVLKKLHKLNIL